MADGWRPERRDLADALRLLTRLPVPADPNAPRGAAAAWAWPLAGLAVAALAASVGALALALALPAGIAAGLALATQVVTTGALHEDGLADTADGFWGGWTRERRLEIMKDSRIGTYGVVALLLVLGLRWQALTWLATGDGGASALASGLVLAGMTGRAAMALVLAVLPNARGDGLSASTGRTPAGALAASLVLTALAALAIAGPGGLLAVLSGVLAASGVGAVARARIGGQTGDVLGASEQLSELAVLLFLAAKP